MLAGTKARTSERTMGGRRDTTPLIYEGRIESRPGLTRLDLRNVAFVLLMLVLIGLAGWLYLYQTSEVASYSREIRDLEQQRERLHREIIVLRAEVASLGSLERVLEVGERLGYALPDASNPTRRLYVAYEPASPPGGSVKDEGTSSQEGQAEGGEEGPSWLSRQGRPWLPRQGLMERLLSEFEAWVASPPDGER